MMELGSEYSLDLSELTIKQNNIFDYMSDYSNVFFFDSGRGALKHIAKFLQPGDEVLLPEFICESVSSSFREQDVRYYNVRDDFSIDINSVTRLINKNTKFFFLMHYFGNVQREELLASVKEIVRDADCVIVEDATHSIFSRKRTVGDYQVCSIRKWIPIPGGGVFYASDDVMGLFRSIEYPKSTDNERAKGMVLKDIFLYDHYDCNAEYRKIFQRSENRLDNNYDIRSLSEFAHFVSQCINIDDIIKRRKDNYYYLNSLLDKIGISAAIEIDKNMCPLVLPIWVRDRDEFRTYMMKHRIYCAVHWPFDGRMEEQRPFAKKCSEHLISLPIDQRYGKKEIDYMVSVIKEYGGELRS